ncbi:hypothetical protein E2320_015726 [Naja naja]|nr:hypothetical protein E2320_015726 [Naja naja]
MQHTTCTEDRIHHALERCLHGLSKSTFSASTWTAGLCLNCWSLQELVNRDAGNYLILLEKILQKTQEVQEKCDYNLFTPLAFLFSATLLCIPHFPSDSDLLLRAVRMYRDFLTWPVPYCNICQELLNFISNELKAPGISFQRLVKAEQGLPRKGCENSTVTADHSQHTLLVTLLEHTYQANFGTRFNLAKLRQILKLKTAEELIKIFTRTTEAQEMAVLNNSEPSTAREQLESALLEIARTAGLPEIADGVQLSKLRVIPMPVARCYVYRWDTDNFDILNEVLDKEVDYPKPDLLENEEEEDEEVNNCFAEKDCLLSTLASVRKDSMYSTLSEDDPCDSQVSVISALSKNSELSLASKKSLKSLSPV